MTGTARGTAHYRRVHPRCTLKRSLILAALALAACQQQPLPPCQDDYCNQARLMVLQSLLNHSYAPQPQTIYVRPCTIYSQIAHAC